MVCEHANTLQIKEGRKEGKARESLEFSELSSQTDSLAFMYFEFFETKTVRVFSVRSLILGGLERE